MILLLNWWFYLTLDGYRGQSLEKKWLFSDVVCNSRFNIIVSDMKHGQIHLLGPDGGFVKYLLTQDKIAHPSLFNSILLIGNEEGLVKEFVSSNMELHATTLLNCSIMMFINGLRFFPGIYGFRYFWTMSIFYCWEEFEIMK